MPHDLCAAETRVQNLLAASSIAFHVIIVGGMYVGAARKKYGIKYPDMGNGRYAKKLTDAQWVDFNNHQRVHQNYVEGVTAAVVLEVGGSCRHGVFSSLPFCCHRVEMDHIIDAMHNDSS